jgi:hypothetical protein
MSATPDNQSIPEPDRLEVAADQAIAACGGDVRDAVKALIVANEFLEAEAKQLRAAVSNGYARGKFESVPRDRLGSLAFAAASVMKIRPNSACE